MILPSTLRRYGAAVRALAVFTLLTGVAYPLAMTGVAQAVFSDKADGSLISRDGKVVGSSLIGQSFTDADGNPVLRYFQSRPSSAGSGYDPTATAASNLGPESRVLLDQICSRSKEIGEREGVSGARRWCTPGFTGQPDVPADAVAASGSGLDPHISVAYALLQAPRVARERGMTVENVRALVARYTTGRSLGFMGEPVVNVLELNLALDASS
ncbi:MAG: potassium-transporting ATPase subunit KdpC [Sporichthyaceae bacterium]